MANRILTFSCKRCDGNPTVMLPAYYLEAEFSCSAVRIKAETAPSDSDAEFEIYADGVSIMDDIAYNYETYIANTATYSGTYKIALPKGATVDEMADNFNDTPIESGSWITCAILNDGGGKNFTVQLELEELSESGEETD